jgi:pimeloyl-ACP methyl ester carboxylesterase
MRVACDAWPAGKASEAFRAPVSSDVPTLFINGAYDPRTPSRYARQQAARMPAGLRIVLRAQGHAPSSGSACAKAAMGAFLDSPRSPTPPACLQYQQAPRFMSRRGPGNEIDFL